MMSLHKQLKLGAPYINRGSGRRRGYVDSDSEGSLQDEAEAAFERMQEIETGVNDEDEWLKAMPASGRWLAAQHGRWRPAGRVSTDNEWKFFNEKLPAYQGQRGDEADNFRMFNFSKMADDWNEWVSDLDLKDYPDETYKTSNHLQDAFDIKKKRANRSSSRRPHVDSLNALRQSQWDPTADESYLNEFVEPEAASLPCPPRASRSVVVTEERETQTDVTIDGEEFFDAEQGLRAIARPKRKRRGKTASHRCRQCGQEYKKDEWRIYHPIPIPDSQEGVRDRNRYLSHQPGAAPHLFCQVPQPLYEPGFPCLDKKTMPRRKPAPVIQAESNAESSS